MKIWNLLEIFLPAAQQLGLTLLWIILVLVVLVQTFAFLTLEHPLLVLALSGPYGPFLAIQRAFIIRY